MKFTSLLHWLALSSSLLSIRSVRWYWQGRDLNSGQTWHQSSVASTLLTEQLKWSSIGHLFFFFLAETFLLGCVRGPNSGPCISKVQDLSISQGCLQSPRFIAASWKVLKNMIFLSQRFPLAWRLLNENIFRKSRFPWTSSPADLLWWLFSQRQTFIRHQQCVRLFPFSPHTNVGIGEVGIMIPILSLKKWRWGRSPFRLWRLKTAAGQSPGGRLGSLSGGW